MLPPNSHHLVLIISAPPRGPAGTLTGCCPDSMQPRAVPIRCRTPKNELTFILPLSTDSLQRSPASYHYPSLWQRLPTHGTTACWYNRWHLETPLPEKPCSAGRAENRSAGKIQSLLRSERAPSFHCKAALPLFRTAPYSEQSRHPLHHLFPLTSIGKRLGWFQMLFIHASTGSINVFQLPLPVLTALQNPKIHLR